MIIGTLLFSVVHWWLTILGTVILHPWFILKVAFLWFCITFAVSYIFFLMVHKADTLHVRQELAKAFGWSCLMGFGLATLLLGFYEFIIQNLIQSRFFQAQLQMLQNLTAVAHDPQALYKRLCFLMVLLSGLFAAHYVGIMLERWYEHRISERYGWFIMACTLLCAGFLWTVNYVM